MSTPFLFLYLLFWQVSPAFSSDPNSFAKEKQQESANLIKQFNQGDVPGYVTDTPAATNLNNHALLDAEAQKGFAKSEDAAALLNSANKRPYFVLDPLDDPIAQNSKEALSDPQSFINRSTYQNRAEPQYIMKTCVESKPERKYTCSKQLIEPQIHIQSSYTIDQGLSNRYYCSRGHHSDNHRKCGSRVYYPLPPIVVPEKTTITPESWKSTCNDLEEKASRGICKIIKQVCLDNSTHHITSPVGATGAVRSIPITKECWHYTYEYECIYPECGGLRKSNCEQMGSKCVGKEGEKCISWEQTFRCPTNTQLANQTLKVQGQGNQIPEGNEHLQFEPNAEMNEAIAKLYFLKEIQNDLALNAAENNKNQTIREVFKGSNGKCTIAFGGFSDCCGEGKGWGQQMNLRRCSGDEKILAQKREKALCVEIGSPYCAEKKAGICIRKKRSFCCFPSKFALVLHKQGRNQVGIGWGSAKHANCRGFTIDELSRLNFAELDFSEFYNELLAKMKHHSTAVVQRNLQHRVGQISSNLKNEQRKGGY